MKKFNDTIGNRTRDLPACSAVLQQTAPPRAPLECRYSYQYRGGFWYFSFQITKNDTNVYPENVIFLNF